MIPKIIHYCWFGKSEKPDIIKKCIESWHKYCPDFEIKEWNESNIDINAISYMADAYKAKKWAFVSDVARLIVLKEYGGIYLDTDVEVLKKDVFNKYLEYENVLVFDNERSIASGLFLAAKLNSSLIEKFLDCYIKEEFDKNRVKTNTTMNKPVILDMFPELIWNASTQVINNNMIMSPGEYNCIMKHYGTRSWLDNNPGYKLTKDNRLKRLLRNPKIFQRLGESSIGNKLLPIYEFISYDVLDLGLIYYIKRLGLKIKNRCSKNS